MTDQTMTKKKPSIVALLRRAQKALREAATEIDKDKHQRQSMATALWNAEVDVSIFLQETIELAEESRKDRR